jgi:hypothetical protein
MTIPFLSWLVVPSVYKAFVVPTRCGVILRLYRLLSLYLLIHTRGRPNITSSRLSKWYDSPSFGHVIRHIAS